MVGRRLAKVAFSHVLAFAHISVVTKSLNTGKLCILFEITNI